MMSEDIDPLNIPLPPTEDKDDHPEPSRKKLKRDDRAVEKNKLEYETELMAKIMGFSEFNSTKGKKVPGNDVGSIHVVKKRRYRQYMNRKGGFNRPLDKVA